MADLMPMNILNYELAGRIVVEWAQGKRKRPEDMEEMRAQLAGIVEIAERYETLQVVQGDETHFILRLPPEKELTQYERKVHEQRDKEQQSGVPQPYDPPKFYEDYIVEGDMDNVSFFYSRISDYTIRGCK
jgi:hypothetical protein